MKKVRIELKWEWKLEGAWGGHRDHGGTAATPPSTAVVWIDLTTTGECPWAFADHKAGCCQGRFSLELRYTA